MTAPDRGFLKEDPPDTAPDRVFLEEGPPATAPDRFFFKKKNSVRPDRVTRQHHLWKTEIEFLFNYTILHIAPPRHFL